MSLESLVQRAKNSSSENEIEEISQLEDQTLSSEYSNYLENNIPAISNFDILNIASVLFGMYQDDFLIEYKPKDLISELETFFISKSPFEKIILKILKDGWNLDHEEVEYIVECIYENLLDKQ